MTKCRPLFLSILLAGCAGAPATAVLLPNAPNMSEAVGAISPDGTLVAVGGMKTVVYDVDNPTAGREIAACAKSRGLAFSPDSKMLACAGNGFTVLDPKTGTTIHSDEGEEYGLTVAFSPDGKVLVVGGAKLIAYDTSSWAMKYEHNGSYITYSGAGFINDTHVVVICDMAKKEVIWDVATNETIFTGETFNRKDMDRSGRLYTGKNRVMSFSNILTRVYALDPDGRDPIDLTYMKELQDYEAMTTGALSADGMLFARDNKVFDYIEGEVESPTIRNRAVLRGESSLGSILAFSPDNTKVLIGKPGTSKAFLVPLADAL